MGLEERSYAMRKTIVLTLAASLAFGAVAMAQPAGIQPQNGRWDNRDDNRRDDRREDKRDDRRDDRRDTRQNERGNRFYQSDRYSNWYHHNDNDRYRNHHSNQGWRGNGWQSPHHQRAYRSDWYVRGNDWDRRWTGGIWVGGLWLGFDDPRLPSTLHGWQSNNWNPPRASWGGRSCQRIVQRDWVHGRDAFVSYRVCVDPWGRRVASDPRFERWAF